MNKKTLIILTLVVVVVIIATVLIFLFYKGIIFQQKTPPDSDIINVNLNVNGPLDEAVNVCQEEKARFEDSSYLLPKYAFYKTLNFHGFCQIDNDNVGNIENLCSQIYENRENVIEQCEIDLGVWGLHYYSFVQKDKERFMDICNFFKKYRPNLSNCEVAWQETWSKGSEEYGFCDDIEIDACPIVNFNDSNIFYLNSFYHDCNNIIDLNEDLDLNNINKFDCKELYLLLSGNQEECDLIEDDLMRLICLNKYTSQPCDEVSNVVNFECEYINTDELKKYIDKYNITGCCDEEREENPPLIRIGEFF